MSVSVVGAGLAGCEAAWQLARLGIAVTLYEMKPSRMSPAHHSPLFAELVCSNSLRSDRLTNAVGLLKEEMRQMDSLVLMAADASRVPAGGALAVDRNQFSEYITEKLMHHPLVTVVSEEITSLPSGDAVIATGPLTSDALAQAIAALPEVGTLHFYDAAAPIVTRESLDMDKVYRASRYERGDDYLNCPLDEAQYNAFVQALVSAETAPVHGFEETSVFEGCMPAESMARRGRMALAFGPMKPVGLVNPRTGRPDFAVVQLRQDDAAGTLYNLVGFQTRLKFPEQRRVFGMIPGLEHAEFARYGVMHRNTYLDSPNLLDHSYRVLGRDSLYFAGQMTGVEGYVESAASGLVAGISLALRKKGVEAPDFTRRTGMGALAHYVSSKNRHFEPMNITFGIMDAWNESRVRDKQKRYQLIGERSLAYLREIRQKFDI